MRGDLEVGGRAALEPEALQAAAQGSLLHGETLKARGQGAPLRRRQTLRTSPPRQEFQGRETLCAGEQRGVRREQELVVGQGLPPETVRPCDEPRPGADQSGTRPLKRRAFGAGAEVHGAEVIEIQGLQG